VAGQILAYSLEVASFSAIFYLSGMPIVANVAAKILAACFAFAFHARISFAYEKAKSLRASAVSYVVVLAINAALTSSLLWILLRLTSFPPLYLKIACDIVFVVLTFGLVGKYVFPSKSEAQS
jgi:putative flippase GtrA